MNEEREQDQFLSTSGAARILGVTPDTVRYLERRGRLPALHLESGQRVFRRSDVEELARRRGDLTPAA
jgi:excisionase family DNA binding protein